MATTEDKLAAYLDLVLGEGSGSAPDDYDSREKLLDYAIEYVSEQDNLTHGCGAGPLIPDIEAWVDAFMAGEPSAQAAGEPFCLQVKFDPIKLGFTLARSRAELRAAFPTPSKLPKRYPVFARKEGLGSAGKAVLCFLYQDELRLLP